MINKEILSENNLELFKNNFINAYNNLSKNLKKEYNKIKKEFPRKIQEQPHVSYNLKEIEAIIKCKKYHKINIAYNLLNKTKIHIPIKNVEKSIVTKRIEKKASIKKTERIMGIFFLFSFILYIIVGLVFEIINEKY